MRGKKVKELKAMWNKLTAEERSNYTFRRAKKDYTRGKMLLSPSMRGEELFPSVKTFK